MGRLDRLPRRTLADGLIVHEATTLRARLLGLAFMGPPPLDHALLIPRCRSVHTFGMRFALDLVWVDAFGRLVRVDRGVRPWRIRSCRAAAAVVELPSPASPPAA